MHREKNEHRVLRRKAGRGAAQESELEAQPAAVRVEEGVEAVRKSVETLSLLSRQERDRGMGHTREAVRAVPPVQFQRRGAEDLRQRARCRAALQLDLKQPLARREIALNAHGIERRFRLDQCDAVVVEGDGDGGSKTGNTRDREIREISSNEKEEARAHE